VQVDSGRAGCGVRPHLVAERPSGLQVRPAAANAGLPTQGPKEPQIPFPTEIGFVLRSPF